MAQTKTRGDQLDIQDISNEIKNDTTSITSIATGLTTDVGARPLMEELAAEQAIIMAIALG